MFRITCAEALAKKGLYRRASAIYRYAAYNWGLSNRDSEDAIRRSNALLDEAKYARLERAKTHGQTEDFDLNSFGGVYVGAQSFLTTRSGRY